MDSRHVVAGAVRGRGRDGRAGPAVGPPLPAWRGARTPVSGGGSPASGVMSWDDASAPGQLARKALRLVLQREPPEEWGVARDQCHALGDGRRVGRPVRPARDADLAVPMGAGAGARSSGRGAAERDPPVGEGVQADLAI